MNRKNGTMKELSIVSTKHARERGQLRGIKMATAELVMRFGKKSRGRGGKFLRRFTKNCVDRALSAGCSTQAIEPAIGVSVICDEATPGIRIMVSILPQNRRRYRLRVLR